MYHCTLRIQITEKRKGILLSVAYLDITRNPILLTIKVKAGYAERKKQEREDRVSNTRN